MKWRTKFRTPRPEHSRVLALYPDPELVVHAIAKLAHDVLLSG
jgi:hypothetical protein